MTSLSAGHASAVCSPPLTALSPASSPASPLRPRKDRPCDACRRRKTRCVTTDDSPICGFCKLHSKECTYLEKPLPRKRKPKDDPTATPAPVAQARRLDSSTTTTTTTSSASSTAASSRPGTAHKPELGAEHSLLTPVSDVQLDWWPRNDCALGSRQQQQQQQQQRGHSVDFEGVSFDDVLLFGEVQPVDSAVVNMAWRVPRELAQDASSEADARLIHDKWSTLLRRQASTSAPDVSAQTLSSIYDPASVVHAFNRGLEMDHATDAAVFEHMTCLSHILAQFLDAFPLAAPAPSEALQDSAREALVRAKPVQIALKEWFTSLPGELKMDAPAASAGDGLSSIASLHLCYYALEVHLHTRIISSISPVSTPADLVGICRHAAKSRLLSAMDFVNRLRPHHLQSLAWHPVASANFASIGTFADLLRRTTTDGDEAQWYEQRLREFRWTMGVSNRNALWLGAVVEVVDGLLERPALGH